MEIRVHGPGQEPEAVAVTMRTPGHDFELAVGFCVTEGLVRSFAELDGVAYCLAGEGEQEYNVVTVTLRRPVDRRGHERLTVANASCGLCGKTTLDEIEQHCAPVGRGPRWRARCSRCFPSGSAPPRPCSTPPAGSTPRRASPPTASSWRVREDVGRHNALDKLVGHAAARAAAPARRRRADGVGSGELRDRPEGGDGRDSRDLRGVGAVEPGGRRGPAFRADPRRLRARRRANVYTHPERIDLEH